MWIHLHSIVVNSDNAALIVNTSKRKRLTKPYQSDQKTNHARWEHTAG